MQRYGAQTPGRASAHPRSDVASLRYTYSSRPGGPDAPRRRYRSLEIAGIGVTDHAEVGRYWNQNADTWTELVRAGYDIYRDLINTPAFRPCSPT
jgi:hypothetical protein